MKTTLLKKSNGSGSGWIGCLSLASIIVLGGGLQALAQTPKNAPPKEAALPGYLNKSAPSGLRFAAPPKPPVAYLPPLPISYDPQPVYTPDFAQPIADFPHTVTATPPPPPPFVSSVQWPDSRNSFNTTNKQVLIPATPVDLGAVNPQMLVRFFSNGKPADVQMLVNDPVGFRVPVKEEKPSSSASYQVK